VANNKIVVSKYKQTFVASTILGRTIDLEKASATLPNAMIEPEQFSAVIYRMAEPKVEIYLFESGKVVCTGTKEQDIYNALTELSNKLSASNKG
jgi:transcription initiation factor TFIID TATA-box-binding protein